MQQLAAWERTRTIRAAKEITCSDSRYIDYSIEIRIVVADAKGERLRFTDERVRTIRTHRAGGVWDMRIRRFVGYSATPVVWYIGEQQERAVLHKDLPLKVIVAGGEGVGKTRGILAPWAVLRLLSFAGQYVEIGATAPTGDRLLAIEQAMRERMPPSWFTWNGKYRTFRLHCGPTMRLVSAQIYSAESGSPIQSHNWVAAIADELQDHMSVENDIEMRLRAAKGGKGWRMNSASMKPVSAFRTFLDTWVANPNCALLTMPGPSNVFVSPIHWKQLKGKLSPNEFDRRVNAKWVASERATYYTWDRKVNLRRIPRDAVDVTEQALGMFDGNFHALVGHDPGTLKDASEILRAYRLPGSPLLYWWVCAEVVTKQTSTAEHCFALSETLDRLGISSDRAYPNRFPLVIADPASKHPTQDQPHTTVYKEFRRRGFAIRSAAPIQKSVPVDARIETVVGLLRNADGVSRLFVDVDAHGAPVAPKLVKAFEHSERDELGRAEQERKSKRYKDDDHSDTVSALGFGMWRLERVTDYPMENAA